MSLMLSHGPPRRGSHDAIAASGSGVDSEHLGARHRLPRRRAAPDAVTRRFDTARYQAILRHANPPTVLHSHAFVFRPAQHTCIVCTPPRRPDPGPEASGWSNARRGPAVKPTSVSG